MLELNFPGSLNPRLVFKTSVRLYEQSREAERQFFGSDGFGQVCVGGRCCVGELFERRTHLADWKPFRWRSPCGLRRARSGRREKLLQVMCPVADGPEAARG